MTPDDLTAIVSAVDVEMSDLDYIEGGRRCAIERHELMDGFWMSTSPRNGGYGAEGTWHDWVTLAKAILAADAVKETP